MNRFLLVPFLILLALFATAVADESETDLVYSGAVAALAPEASVLGDAWVVVPGLVIEDLADSGSHPPEVRPVVESLKKQLEPLGIRKAADFSYRLPDTLRFVTLRVFVFDTPKSCAQWWEKKYHHEGWEKFYVPVEGTEYPAVDSTQLPKRAIAFGNVLMTCQSLESADNYLAVLDAAVRGAREAIVQE